MAPSLRVFRWLFVISCFICLGIRATDQNMLSVKDENGNTVNVKYEAIGCYSDKINEARSLRELYFNARSLIKWSSEPDFTNIIRACVEHAYSKGHKTIFGIQYYGECWSDESAEARYSKYGVSSNCAYGVGKDLANMVYRMSVIPKSPVEGCNINGKEYSEGAAMMIPNDWSDNVYDSKCMKCICSGGQAKDCQVHSYCETGNEGLCSRWRNATGQCCPVCDCYHDGKVMEAGSTWAVRQGSSCSECTCGDNKIAKCTIKFSCICSDGYDAIPVPGKCCPKCVPKVTTTAPTPTPEILVETTKRPPPTFPPPPDME
ncbi:uncharacterized protein LOC116287167 [Actinia tenebrosa]|uniref:Uncharacterized protein LOC116287167 n=1 Tax=Actinia tenebrosa TaxID=6105 RepID=A0A6P8GZS5_ACTTE|nr:uncharacterized protein LOC116287167 [Actinia tenebrosa]